LKKYLCSINDFKGNYSIHMHLQKLKDYTEKKLDIDGNEVSLQIWDTACQERYRTLVKNYYNGSKAAILVYDISKSSTFDEIKKYWYKEIKENCPDIILGIAGNKFDLFSIEEITEEEGRKFAKEIGAFFYLTSAKESVGIEDLFREVGKKFIENKNNNSYNNDDNLVNSKLSQDKLKKNKKNCC